MMDYLDWRGDLTFTASGFNEVDNLLFAELVYTSFDGIVNKLLKQYEMMQKMMKQFKKSPKGFARRLGGMMGNPGAFRGLK